MQLFCRCLQLVVLMDAPNDTLEFIKGQLRTQSGLLLSQQHNLLYQQRQVEERIRARVADLDRREEHVVLREEDVGRRERQSAAEEKVLEAADAKVSIQWISCKL